MIALEAQVDDDYTAFAEELVDNFPDISEVALSLHSSACFYRDNGIGKSPMFERLGISDICEYLVLLEERDSQAVKTYNLVRDILRG